MPWRKPRVRCQARLFLIEPVQPLVPRNGAKATIEGQPTQGAKADRYEDDGNLKVVESCRDGMEAGPSWVMPSVHGEAKNGPLEVTTTRSGPMSRGWAPAPCFRYPDRSFRHWCAARSRLEPA